MDDVIHKEVPLRPDGSERRFWFDPDIPGHILHLADDGVVYEICGHNIP